MDFPEMVTTTQVDKPRRTWFVWVLAALALPLTVVAFWLLFNSIGGNHSSFLDGCGATAAGAACVLWLVVGNNRAVKSRNWLENICLMTGGVMFLCMFLIIILAPNSGQFN